MAIIKSSHLISETNGLFELKSVSKYDVYSNKVTDYSIFRDRSIFKEFRYIYDENGRITHRYENNEEILIRREYDDLNRITKEYLIRNENIRSRIVFSYNDKGLVSKELHSDLCSKADFNIEIYDYYDDGTFYLPVRTVTNVYDDFDRLIKKVSEDQYQNSNVKVYNIDGSYRNINYYLASEFGDYTVKFSDFDKDNLLVRVGELVDQDEEHVLTRYSYKYDEFENWIERIPLGEDCTILRRLLIYL